MKTLGKNLMIRMIRRKKDGMLDVPDTFSDGTTGTVIDRGNYKDYEFPVKVGDVVGFDPRRLTPVTWDGEQKDRYILHIDDAIYKETDSSRPEQN